MKRHRNFNKMIYFIYKIKNSRICCRKLVLESLIALIFCCLLVANSGCLVSSLQWNDNAVALVNGAEISIQEFERKLRLNREIVAAELRKKYGAENETDLWKTSDDKTSPVNILKEKSLNDCVRFKIEQLAAKEKDLIPDISYEKFLTAFNEENERRKKAIERGEVIYGPKQYRENVYYDYLFGTTFRNLKEQLSTNEFNISEERLKAFYQVHKDERYKRRDNIKVQVISIDYAGEKRENAGLTRDKARETMTEIKRRIGDSGIFFESADNNDKTVVATERILNGAAKTGSMEEESKLETKAARLNVGDVSEVFEENKAFHIIKCVDKIAAGYFTFDEIREIVKSQYIDEQYRLFIDEKVNSADVEINRKIYDKITIN